MLGERIDYWLLKSLAHARNRATEEELDRDGCSSLLQDQEQTKLAKILDRFEGALPVAPGLRYLDMGCGSGELTLSLAKQGVSDIVGVDSLPRFVQAARRNAAAAGLDSRVRFVCEDLHTWRPPHRFDVALSFDALEHIENPRAFLAKMSEFLVPGGIAAICFGPLFHSPFGDHMSEFFRVQVPWRSLLFSENAMLRVRREFYRPTDPATRYSEIVGGLNLMRYSDFLRDARETGWRFRYLRTNAFLRQPLLRGISAAASRVPVIRDLFAHNVYAVMERTASVREQVRDTSPQREKLAA
jgi:SAM-dependent methyltransferase